MKRDTSFVQEQWVYVWLGDWKVATIKSSEYTPKGRTQKPGHDVQVHGYEDQWPDPIFVHTYGIRKERP